jgi:hypothetical protein
LRLYFWDHQCGLCYILRPWLFLDYIASVCRMSEFERILRKTVVPKPRYHSGICLKELNKTMKTLSKDILVPTAPDTSLEPCRYIYLLSGSMNAICMNCVRNIQGTGGDSECFLVNLLGDSLVSSKNIC